MFLPSGKASPGAEPLIMLIRRFAISADFSGSHRVS
jgi:hypothetical protein